MTGTILERKAEKGEFVTVPVCQYRGGRSARLRGRARRSCRDIQVELDIAQDDFAKLKPKQRAIITVDAFPDRKYEGEIAEMSPEANRQKATVQVKVQILESGRVLASGHERDREVSGRREQGRRSARGERVVPSTAVRDRDGKKVVFIVLNGKAVMKTVGILEQRNNGYLVDGPINGENVISNPPENLKDGETIRIKGQPHEYDDHPENCDWNQGRAGPQRQQESSSATRSR